MKPAALADATKRIALSHYSPVIYRFLAFCITVAHPSKETLFYKNSCFISGLGLGHLTTLFLVLSLFTAFRNGGSKRNGTKGRRKWSATKNLLSTSLLNS